MGLHQGTSARITGEIKLDGEELVGADPARVRELRGGKMAMIFQDPLSSLHPYFKVGDQIAEAYRIHHRDASRKQARQRAVDMLGRVGIPRPSVQVDSYPHQFSGGMRQRVMIAMALSNDPELLIADEPTTALDVTVQAQILELIADLQDEFGTAVILITHDLGVVAELADDILVMYAGRAVEYGPPWTSSASRPIRTPGACWPRCRASTGSGPPGSSRSPARRPAAPGSRRAAPSIRAAGTPSTACVPRGAGVAGGLAGAPSTATCPPRKERGVGSCPDRSVVAGSQHEGGQPQTSPCPRRARQPRSNGELLRDTTWSSISPYHRGVFFRQKVGAVRAVDGVDLSVPRARPSDSSASPAAARRPSAPADPAARADQRPDRLRRPRHRRPAWARCGRCGARCR